MLDILSSKDLASKYTKNDQADLMRFTMIVVALNDSLQARATRKCSSLFVAFSI